jgi:hypothetical protein
MTALFLTTILPGGRGSGSEIVSTAFVEAMRAAGERVVVVGYARKGEAPEAADRDRVVVAERHIETRSSGLWPLAWMAKATATRTPYSLAKYRSRAYRRAVRDAIAELSPELIVVDHLQVAWAVDGIGAGVPLAYLAHNVESELYREAARRSRSPTAWANRREARLIAVAEKELVARAATTWTLSRQDADALQRIAAGPPPRSFSVPTPIAERPPGDAASYDVGVLGTWTWGPNALGLRWFVDSVVPRLGEGISVAVAGSGAEGILDRCDRVQAVGRVADADLFLASAKVVAVPSTDGAGVQIKTLDAIGTGSPVVATSVAMRGVGDPPATVRVADGPAEFAAAIEAALERPLPAGARAGALEWVRSRRQRFAAAVADELGRLGSASPSGTAGIGG